MLEYPLVLLFPVAMLYAGIMDFFTMTIPNRISIALVLGFFGAALLGGMSWTAILTHAGVAMAVLVVSFGMFSRGWIGGGDAKLWPAAVLWFGYEQAFDYTILVALIGGLLASFILTYRHAIPPVMVAGRDWAERLHDKSAGIPYGVALAVAALWLFPSSPVFLSYAV